MSCTRRSSRGSARSSRATSTCGPATSRRSGPRSCRAHDNGIRWLSEPGVRRVVLAPSYLVRPYNFTFSGGDWRMFVYPVADEATEPNDPLAPPEGVLRLHRALGDDTRLRILRLLRDRDFYLTEIAERLELSKPTIKHHLAQLRAAGLVTLTEEGGHVLLQPPARPAPGRHVRAQALPVLGIPCLFMPEFRPDRELDELLTHVRPRHDREEAARIRPMHEPMHQSDVHPLVGDRIHDLYTTSDELRASRGPQRSTTRPAWSRAPGGRSDFG